MLFYPCVYIFAIWDAYRDAGATTFRYSFLPSVCSAYFGTIGVILSPVFTLFAITFGPIWLGILGMLIGAVIGVGMKWILLVTTDSPSN